MKNLRTLIALAPFALLFACSSTPEPAATDAEPSTTASASAEAPVDAPPTTERPEMTSEDCTAKGGQVVGDIGDGAIHRPEYRCASGSPPIGRIPLGIEGSVCCT